VLGGDPGGRPLRGETLQRRPDHIRLLQVQAARPADDRAAVRTMSIIPPA
jgi:hypothetical protein